MSDYDQPRFGLPDASPWAVLDRTRPARTAPVLPKAARQKIQYAETRKRYERDYARAQRLGVRVSEYRASAEYTTELKLRGPKPKAKKP